MTAATTTQGGFDRARTARRTARAAWEWWAAMLVLPIIVLAVGMVFVGPGASIAWNRASIFFFTCSVIWMVLATPATLVLRSHCFRAAWHGRSIQPARYVRGVVTVWGALEIAVMLAVLGALASAAWMPCLLPAGIGWMLMATLWPSERALAV